MNIISHKSIVVSLLTFAFNGCQVTPSVTLSNEQPPTSTNVIGIIEVVDAGKDCRIIKNTITQADGNKKYEETKYCNGSNSREIVQMNSVVSTDDHKVRQALQNFDSKQLETALLAKKIFEAVAYDLGIPKNRISEALMGQYKDNQGKIVYFTPNIENLKLVYQAMPKPPSDDPEVLRRIDYLIRHNSRPPAGYLISWLERIADYIDNNIDYVKKYTGITRNEFPNYHLS